MNLPSVHPRDLTQPFRRRPPGTWRRLAWVPLAAFGLMALVHLVANLDAITSAIRAKTVTRLEARLGPVSLGPRASVGWWGEVRLGPLRIPATGDPLVQIDEIGVRPSLWALLRGSAEPGRIRLDGVAVHTDRSGQRLIDFEHDRPHSKPDTTGGSRSGSQHDLHVEFDRLEISVESEADPQSPRKLGPLRGSLSLESQSGGSLIDATVRIGSQGAVRLHGTQEAMSLALDRVPLLPFAVLVPTHGIEVLDGLASGIVELHRDHTNPQQVSVSLDAGVSRLSVENARLASTPVGPAEGRFTGTVSLDLAKRTLAIEGAKVSLGADRVEIPLDCSLELGATPRFSVDARLGPVGIQKLIASMPPQLQPGPLAPTIDGPIRAEARLNGPIKRPADWSLEVRLDTSAFKATAREAPFPLRDPFAYTPKDQTGPPRTLWIGERSSTFVPYNQLPGVVPAAIMGSEDITFLSHNGFDFPEILEAFTTSEEGARMRGGSTLSQQLVKNLYLSRERTLARKIREAFITMEMEAALPKTRILEIYLNAIEWGPDIYGIEEASRYYFGISARSLDTKQAVFLASIIPNPRKFGPYFKHHPLTDQWEQRIVKVIGLMRDRGVIDEAVMQRALVEPLAFRG